ncbi:Acetyltransferase (GNAT) domain-containing protein [Clostridium amylolyticum]|uniref:Acetyltransferase (GNAT) domain-containing protein n=1 Tax=Clostridium amylolyticum TaxID=1121298 RepID=A0A1M6N432_9CLOT|nr:GNAT family N-acetyltransferase [Clostridium amylolyticum]SHJ90454.1 Acetyltransferase (GNAT) domain-containing protein [Clostridium amylolyticum]
MSNITVTERKPTVEEYIQLRNSVGWKILQNDNIKKGLDNSIYCVCVEDQDNIIGFGRIVGDYGTVFYIQDIIVKQPYQKQKIGTLIMKKLMEYIDNNCIDDAIIGLIAISELDKFYKKFGFTYNQDNRFYRYK